jgi:predicted metal-binding transcription factor (methanogenesis marker protein 9)
MSCISVGQAFDSLELTEEKMHAITDKIPQKPVTLVEGTSYMVVILGAFAVSCCKPSKPCRQLDATQLPVAIKT